MKLGETQVKQPKAPKPDTGVRRDRNKQPLLKKPDTGMKPAPAKRVRPPKPKPTMSPYQKKPRGAQLPSTQPTQQPFGVIRPVPGSQ